MAVERTLSIIKPDAVKKNAIGQILARFEEAVRRRQLRTPSVKTNPLQSRPRCPIWDPQVS